MIFWNGQKIKNMRENESPNSGTIVRRVIVESVALWNGGIHERNYDYVFDFDCVYDVDTPSFSGENQQQTTVCLVAFGGLAACLTVFGTDWDGNGFREGISCHGFNKTVGRRNGRSEERRVGKEC